MNKKIFKCVLKSDVVISEKSATEGNQTTLDFIPGGNFYGIVANKLYKEYNANNEGCDKETQDKIFTVLHSGKVRFGDAHPTYGDERMVHVPATLFAPKQGGAYFLHAQVMDLIASNSNKREEFNRMQLKQCRKGYYFFDAQTKEAHPAIVDRRFSLKSAYDRGKRRSKDAEMFGKESLCKGLEMIFEIYYDDEAANYMKEVANALIGVQRVGHSRSAQYGLVEILPLREESVENISVKAESEISLFADGRVICFDQYGIPTCRPTAAELGLPGEIIWEKSQIRTFQYAPWNYKRQSLDTDRYGLEKGSVIVVRLTEDTVIPPFLGLYQTEGFGRVLVNPDCLEAVKETAVSVYTLIKPEDEQKLSHGNSLITTIKVQDSLLIRCLESRKSEDDYKQKVYEEVEKFMAENASLFVVSGSERTEGEKAFASQWSKIRNIATVSRTKKELLDNLFAEPIDDNKKSGGYLMHGVAKDKWKQQGRGQALTKFIDDVSEVVNERYVLIAVANLAAGMAKKCTSKKDANGK